MRLSNRDLRPIRTTWDDLKSHITKHNPLQYESKNLTNNTYYQAYVRLNNFLYFTNLYSSGHWKHVEAEYDDFVDNYKTDIDTHPPTDSGVADGTKVMVHQTSRVPGTTTYFSCASDSQADPSMVGGAVTESEKLKGHHEIGDPVVEFMYMDLNCIDNETHIHEGYFQWKDALNDDLSVSFVPTLTEVSASTNTFYNMYGGYLVIPAAGDGVTQVDVMNLVEMPMNEYGRRPAAYWNADYNTTTKVFENITAAPLADGRFNMFTVEITFEKFANQVPLLGSGFMQLQTSDSSRLGHNMRIKVEARTVGVDHDWWWNAFATFHRIKTTNG